MHEMKDKKAIQEETNKTLHCLDGVERVKPRPFFYTRLKQRLDELERREAHSPLDILYVKFLRPALIPLLIVVSIASGVFWGNNVSITNRSENISAVAEFYGLDEPHLNNYILTSNE